MSPYVRPFELLHVARTLLVVSLFAGLQSCTPRSRPEDEVTLLMSRMGDESATESEFRRLVSLVGESKNGHRFLLAYVARDSEDDRWAAVAVAQELIAKDPQFLAVPIACILSDRSVAAVRAANVLAAQKDDVSLAVLDRVGKSDSGSLGKLCRKLLGEEPKMGGSARLPSPR